MISGSTRTCVATVRRACASSSVLTTGCSFATVSSCSRWPAAYAASMRFSSTASGKSMEIFIIKRSRCASGSGYVPSNSTGFCVAKTVKIGETG